MAESNDIVDLTALPVETALDNVQTHIATIEAQVNDHLNAIENIKDTTAALKRKIDNIGEQIPGAEQILAERTTERTKIETEFEQAERILQGLNNTNDDFVSTLF
jgi:chromosome segregation ATPase